MVKNKKSIVILLGFILLAFSFFSCSFEQVITTLGQTGKNYLTGSANAGINAENARNACSTTISDVYDNLADKVNQAGKDVWQIIEDAKNAESMELLDRCKDILGVVAMSNEQYFEVLNTVTRASLSDEGVKNFVQDFTEEKYSLSLSKLVRENEDIKTTIIDAIKDGLETVMSDYIDEGGNQEEEEDIMSFLVDFIDSAFSQAEAYADTLLADPADLLMLSMIATTAISAIDIINNAHGESQELSAVIQSSDLISQAVGLIQVAGSIEKGCQLNDRPCSPVVSVIANLADIADFFIEMM